MYVVPITPLDLECHMYIALAVELPLGQTLHIPQVECLCVRVCAQVITCMYIYTCVLVFTCFMCIC